MQPLQIIEKYYQPGSKEHKIFVIHAAMVTKKALEIAKRIPERKPDLQFIQEAAMLHDIGIFKTDAQDIGCHGDKPYICHGYLGREVLEKEGLSKHALVCERHTGVGISKPEIEKNKLPIPKRDMNPISLEEEIICFADCFYSKDPMYLTEEKSLKKIRDELAKFGKDKVEKFNQWCELFKETNVKTA